MRDLLIQSFDSVDLSTTAIYQVGPGDDFDEAHDRERRLADGRKFDADGTGDALVIPGAYTAVFCVLGATAEAVGDSVDTITALLGDYGSLTAISRSSSSDTNWSCSARLKSIRKVASSSLPFVRNRQYAQYLELTWSKITVWSETA